MQQKIPRVLCWFYDTIVKNYAKISCTTHKKANQITRSTHESLSKVNDINFNEEYKHCEEKSVCIDRIYKNIYAFGCVSIKDMFEAKSENYEILGKLM